jgi:hypothetical protein
LEYFMTDRAITTLGIVAHDNAQPDEVRISAIRSLGTFMPNDHAISFLGLVAQNKANSPAVRAAAAAALARI